MKTDFRNRVVLPIVLPLAVLLGLVVLVGGFAAILLFNTHEVALMLALVVAAGVMVAFSLASSVEPDHMTIGRRGVIAAVGVLPLLVGGAVSLWAVNGGVPAEELMINVEPELRAPEGALAGAKNAESFCTFEDPENQTAETCTDTEELTFPAQPDAEAFAYVFNNVHNGVAHNLQLFELVDGEGGETIFGTDDGSEIITGPAEIVYEVPVEDPALFEEGAEFYYNCVVHPAMQGVLTIGPPAGEGEGGEG